MEGPLNERAFSIVKYQLIVDWSGQHRWEPIRRGLREIREQLFEDRYPFTRDKMHTKFLFKRKNVLFNGSYLSLNSLE